MVIMLQKYHHGFLDAFIGLSCIVSVPFYTAFLPLIFWSGYSKLGRQMTLFRAFCVYIGNSLKDLVCSPRPNSSSVRRVTVTKEENKNALEYGLPSSHALNTVCLSGYLAHFVLLENPEAGLSFKLLVVVSVLVLVALIGYGRIYLDMHSPIDVVGRIAVGVVILAFWISIYESLGALTVSKQHGSLSLSELALPICVAASSFWACLAVFLLFAYPKPEFLTPSFEFHTGFNGVALEIVCGVQQTYDEFHHEAVPHILSQQLSLKIFVARILFGFPTILIVQFCSKALAKWSLPILRNTLGIPIKSSCYIPTLNVNSKGKSDSENIRSCGGYLDKLFSYFGPHVHFHVDTGVRFLQYAGLVFLRTVSSSASLSVPYLVAGAAAS